MKKLILPVLLFAIHCTQSDDQVIFRKSFTGPDAIPFFWIDPQPHDRVENLVDAVKLTNIEKMDNLTLMTGTLETQPWSDSYWPIYQGVLANRYLDPNFSPGPDWLANSKYLRDTVGKVEPVMMSPAEKYDLLVGDKSFTLTSKMLDEGKRYQDHTGKVESWMGICHGWAPASFMLSRPKTTVKVLAADGKTEIVFLPSDIKALASLLWANGGAKVKFIGGRCNKKDPEEDGMGRPKDQECLDNNPGTWHLAVVNQLGIGKRSLIMDANYDYQVWNHPIIGYSYKYFNVKTKQRFDSYLEARVAISEMPDDKFKSVRSGKAVYLVGVTMDVDYVTETSPSPEEVDSADNDRTTSTKFIYDLELDSAGEIVGGEWHDNVHPDFLWTPAKDARATSFGDRTLDYNGDSETWEITASVPETWKKVARQTSSFGQPLARVVEKLVELSNQGEDHQ